MRDTDTPCTPGLAGTDDETYYLNSRGEWYLIQSPNLTLPYERVSKPPARAEELPWSASYDLDIPDEIQ